MNPKESQHRLSPHITVKKERGISTLAVHDRRGPCLAGRVPKMVVMCGPEQSVLLGGLGKGTHLWPCSLSCWESLHRLLQALLQCQSVLVCPGRSSSAGPPDCALPPHHPPPSRPQEQLNRSVEPGQWQKAAVGMQNAGQALLCFLSFGVCKAGCRDPAWASRPQLGLQWKKASLKSNKK